MSHFRRAPIGSSKSTSCYFYSEQTLTSRPSNFIIGLITPPLVENTGYGAYVFFAVFCLLSLIWTFFFVPETKGRTLEQMDHVFKDISSEEEEERRDRIERDIVARSNGVAH